MDRSANPSPGNKRGGLTNIVEKALGSVAKAGTSAIAGVFGPGERVTTKGLIFAATPASDFICGTLQLAAAMNMHIFTTGRGTPYGLAMVPVIKVASRTSLAERWVDLIDLDAGTIATGEATIGQVGTQLFQMVLDVASGRQRRRGRIGGACTTTLRFSIRLRLRSAIFPDAHPDPFHVPKSPCEAACCEVTTPGCRRILKSIRNLFDS